MNAKQVQDIVTQAIAATPLSREKYYHICWWEDRLQCLHARHTKDVHEAFYSAPGQILMEGLSAYQWKLLTERIIGFCHRRRISLSACAERGNSERGANACGQAAQVTDFDSMRLRVMLAGAEAPGSVRDSYLRRLRQLLDGADTVPPHDVSADVVTMNSRIRLRDKHDTEMTVALVFPEDATRGEDHATKRVSILTPIGLAMLGRRVGHLIADRIRIDGLVYQPENAGDFHL